MNSSQLETYKNSRREALIIVLFSLGVMIFILAYCYQNGLPPQSKELTLIWGIPTWVFWGIIIPWGVCNIFTAWFCFRVISIDELGDDDGEKNKSVTDG